MTAVRRKHSSIKNYTPFWSIVFPCALLLLVLHPTWAQSPDSLKRKLSYQAIVGGGVSRFHVYDVPASPDYRSAEALAGIRISKPIGRVFSLMSGLSFGVKFKRESYFGFLDPPGRGLYTREPAVEPGLDYSASRGNGYYLSLPLALVVKVNGTSTIYGGLNARSWWGRSQDYPLPDALGGLDELGVLFGTSTKIAGRLSVGLECYSGLKDISYSSILLPGASRAVDLRVINQNAMIVVRYSF